MKLILICFFAAGLALSAAVFDAAAAARTAMELNEAARQASAARAKDRFLTRAEQALQGRWSAPTWWHAGAIEALSWNKALRAELSRSPARWRESGAALERGLSLAPVQPKGWYRLAAIRRAGIGRALCDARVCLERSWKASPAADADFACARLNLAHALGVRLRRDDPRVRAFIDIAPDRATLARCLSFLPAEDLFAVLVSAPRD
jgi:hypothetical protein